MTEKTSKSPWVILAAMLIGTVLGTMGNSMVNLALPSLQGVFGISLTDAVWTVTLYTLTFAVLMPVYGKLGSLHGPRRIYLLGMSLYALGALLAGLAPAFGWLLAARVLQGVGIASVLPTIMNVISHIFKQQERGRATGYWAFANGAGHAIGPPLSGFLLQYAGWRWIFLVTVPFCLVSLYLVWRLLPPDGERRQEKFDIRGAVLLTLSALSLMLALSQSANLGWGSPISLGLWACLLVFVTLFIRTERRAQIPFVDLSLFSLRPYVASIAVIAAHTFSLFGFLVAMPVLLIQHLGYTSDNAGLIVLSLNLLMTLASPRAGQLSDHFGSRQVGRWGMGVIVAGEAALLGLTILSGVSLPWWVIVLCLMVTGVGLGLIQSPATVAVLHLLPREQVGVAEGIFHMCRFISGTLGSTVMGVILETSRGGIPVGFQNGMMVLLGVAVLVFFAAARLPGKLEKI